MKKNLIAAAMLAAGIASMAAAQTAAPNKVGVIQVQSALVATRDGQKAAKELGFAFSQSVLMRADEVIE